MPMEPIRTGADYASIELGFEPALRTRVRSMVRDALAPRPDATRLAALAAAVDAYLEAAVGELVRHNPPPTPLACRSGCDHCCHNLITTTPLQVFAIARRLEATLDPASRADLRRRLDTTLAAQAATGWTAWALGRPRCPLLRDGGCAAYAVRPFGCRGWSSLGAGACAADLTRKSGPAVAIPFSLPQAKIATAIQDGIRAGLVELGLEAGPVELAAGLKVALGVPNAATRWLAGEAIFAATSPVGADESRGAQARVSVPGPAGALA